MTVSTIDTTRAHAPRVILGITHLSVNDKLTYLLKCPFCDFRNIFEEEIDHHIQFSQDKKHEKDPKRLSKRNYIVTGPRTGPYGPYVRKKDIPLPWIKCLWCEYIEKIEFDLSLHFLENHKKELMAIPISRQERVAAKNLIKDSRARFFARFESPMEYRLDKAVKMAKEKTKEKSGVSSNGDVK